MRWHEITIHTREEAQEMISNFLHEMGAGGVAIEESGTLNKQRDTSLGQWYELPLNDIPEGEAVIKGYFAEPEQLEKMIQELAASIERLREYDIDPGSASIEVKEVNEEDWANAWKQYYKPLRISERITVKPTWEDYQPENEEELIIELDPGMAFGTGTHPTTSLCLKTLERWLQGGEDVIDVGTGSGILSIAAAKLGAKHVLALDLDPVSVVSANENIELNVLEDKVTVMLSDLLSVLRSNESESGSESDTIKLGVTIPVQAVVANILAEIILLFVKEVYEVLEHGGIYIASGIIASKQAVVESALLSAGFSIAEICSDQDWIVIVARK